MTADVTPGLTGGVPYETRVESINLGDLAREEIAAARAQGIDPMDLARTHERMARLIPAILNAEKPQSTQGGQ